MILLGKNKFLKDWRKNYEKIVVNFKFVHYKYCWISL